MDTIRLDEIRRARELFESHEPRDLFYRAATELVRLAFEGKTSINVAEALAVLLLTWNRAFYQYRRFSEQHIAELEHCIDKHNVDLLRFRHRRIDSLHDGDREIVLAVFGDFEVILGPVGAAKGLHLLAPNFFPLWDRAIATAYGLSLGRTGTNARRYWAFMAKVRDQALALGPELADDTSPLKAIDEYNYCKYTKRWI